MLAFCLIFALVPRLIPSVEAAAKITDTVNLSRPEKNMRGSGYYWDNREDTLTLDGLYIDTDADYGLRIPDDATVILKGKNYVSASKAAMTVPGNVTFKGNGSLILTSDDMGIYFYSTKDNTVARFLSGSYEITAGGNGIYSTHTALSFVGSDVEIDAPAADKFAILGREVKLYGGEMEMNNSVHATVSLEVRAVELDIESAKAALSSDKTLTIEEVALKVGPNDDALGRADAYNGENCVEAESTLYTLGHSIIFGDSVPMFVDVLIALVLLLLIAAGIAVPFIRSRRKAKAARAAVAAALADEPRSAKR